MRDLPNGEILLRSIPVYHELSAIEGDNAVEEEVVTLQITWRRTLHAIWRG